MISFTNLRRWKKKKKIKSYSLLFLARSKNNLPYRHRYQRRSSTSRRGIEMLQFQDKRSSAMLHRFPSLLDEHLFPLLRYRITSAFVALVRRYLPHVSHTSFSPPTIQRFSRKTGIHGKTSINTTIRP